LNITGWDLRSRFRFGD